MRSAPAGRCERIRELTRIDPWFLAQIEELIAEEKRRCASEGLGALTAERLRVLKRKGFSDSRLGRLLDMPEKAIRDKRHELGVRARLQARRHLRRGVRDLDRLPVLDLRGGVRGAARPTAARS